MRLGPEEYGEEHHHHSGKTGGQRPELRPLIQRQRARGAEESVVDLAGDQAADQHADSVGDEHQKPLRLATHRRRRLLVDVDLAGHKEEVVTDAVEQNPGDDQPEHGAGSGNRKQHITKHPCSHTHQQHLLHAEPGEHQRHEEHEAGLRHLAERHQR